MHGPARTQLSDGSLVLRPWRLEDVGRVAEICVDPEIGRWTTVPSPYNDEHARTWIEQTIRNWDAREGEAAFAVTDAESGEVLGAIGLRPFENRARGGSIGYWVAPDARGRGVATGALRLVSEWALRELGLPRVELVTLPGNEPSQRVAEKAGYARAGTVRMAVRGEDEEDCVCFSLATEALDRPNQGTFRP